MNPPNFIDWFEYEPYSLDANKKASLMNATLCTLTKWHKEQCGAYARILNMLRIDIKSIRKIEDIPYIPIRLFKEFDLLSIDKGSIFKNTRSKKS